MRRLILLRHAKALRPPQTSDHERPLSSEGVAAADQAGRSIVSAGWQPDLALVSDSLRTRQTFETMRRLLDPGLPVRFEPGLYEATSAALVAIIRAAPQDRNCLLVVGHNPSIGETARRLSADGASDDLLRLRSRFPTAAIATVSFDISAWRDIGRGRLEAFVWVDPTGTAE